MHGPARATLEARSAEQSLSVTELLRPNLKVRNMRPAQVRKKSASSENVG